MAALAEAIGTLKRHSIPVDEKKWLPEDQRWRITVVIERVWAWVVSTAFAIGSVLYKGFVKPFCRQDLVIEPMRNRGQAPVGLCDKGGRSGAHALMQMAMHVDAWCEVVKGWATLGCALEKVPCFKEKVETQRQAERQANLEDSDGEEKDEVASKDEIQKALDKPAKLEAMLEEGCISRSMGEEGVTDAVINHLWSVKELECFFEKYRQAQGAQAYRMSFELDRFFAMCGCDRVEGADAAKLFEKMIPPVRLSTEVACHLKDQQTFELTGYGAKIDQESNTGFQSTALRTLELPSPGLPLGQSPRDQGVERRRIHLPLEIKEGDCSFGALLERFASRESSFDLSYTMCGISKQVEEREGNLRRVFTRPPEQFFTTLDRVQWHDRGVVEPPVRVVRDEELAIPLKEMSLPDTLYPLGRSPKYQLDAFVAFDPQKNQYSFYRRADMDRWFEIKDQQARGMIENDVTEIVSRQGVILHFVKQPQ